MSRASFSTMVIQFLTALVFTCCWLIMGHGPLYTKELALYRSGTSELFLDFCFDEVTAVYLMVGSLLSFLIIAYSRSYLHREGGYKRFFSTIMFFYLGYNILVLSGNISSLFIGWEVAGISSFLLIGYYRGRYIPVKNSVKIFSIYRIADMAFILALWAGHHLWSKSIVIPDLGNRQAVAGIIAMHPGLAVFFSSMIVLAASIKSAQLPFSSWLPRAMEGPTPSSAIFYSSLSVHAGLLLLLRTYHFWESLLPVKIAIAVIGGLTFIIATLTARVQSSIKGQIAYSSVAQIGLMFIETALGLQWLVLIHFAGNAFFRSYQLLISPSAVTYLIREQFYSASSPAPATCSGWFRKLKNSFYVLSVEEWFMDEFMHHTIWNFLKTIGKRTHFITRSAAIASAVVLLALSLAAFAFSALLPAPVMRFLPGMLALSALVFSLRSFTEKQDVYLAWFLVVLNHILVATAISLSEKLNLQYLLLYLGGIFAAAVSGILFLRRLRKLGITLTLNWYQGHCYEHPKINFGFLVSCLALFGFPVTTAFLGIELMYGYIHTHQVVLLVLVSLVLLVNSLSLIRMYSRIFLGPHIRTYHEIARKSS